MPKKPNFIVRFEEVQILDIKVYAKDKDAARDEAMTQVNEDWLYNRNKVRGLLKEKTIVKIPRVAKYHE